MSDEYGAPGDGSMEKRSIIKVLLDVEAEIKRLRTEIRELRANQKEFRDEVLRLAREEAQADAKKAARRTQRRVLSAR